MIELLAKFINLLKNRNVDYSEPVPAKAQLKGVPVDMRHFGLTGKVLIHHEKKIYPIGMSILENINGYLITDCDNNVYIKSMAEVSRAGLRMSMFQPVESDLYRKINNAYIGKK